MRLLFSLIKTSLKWIKVISGDEVSHYVLLQCLPLIWVRHILLSAQWYRFNRNGMGSKHIKHMEIQSSQVKLLITNNSFCIVQRATAQSKNRNFFRDYGVAPPGFQAGWSDCMYFFSVFLFILFAHLELMQPRHCSPWDDQTANIARY
jgi:hypothetical protein